MVIFVMNVSFVKVVHHILVYVEREVILRLVRHVCLSTQVDRQTKTSLALEIGFLWTSSGLW